MKTDQKQEAEKERPPRWDRSEEKDSWIKKVKTFF